MPESSRFSWLPSNAEEYRQWWREHYPEIPYGTCVCGCGAETGYPRQTVTREQRFKGEPKRFKLGHDKIRPAPPRHNVNTNGGLCECGCNQPAPIAAGTVAKRGIVKGEPLRFIHGHNACSTPYSLVEYIAEDCGYGTLCWTWQRMKNDRGYGMLRLEPGGPAIYAHRYYYEQNYGPIPDGLELDHLCEEPSCCRPTHTEPVTHAENVRRWREGRG